MYNMCVTEPLMACHDIVDRMFYDEKAKVQPTKISIVAGAILANLAIALASAMHDGSLIVLFPGASLTLPVLVISAVALIVLFSSMRPYEAPKIIELLCSTSKNDEKKQIIRNLTEYQRLRIMSTLLENLNGNLRDLMDTSFDIKTLGKTELEKINPIITVIRSIQAQLNALCLLSMQKKNLQETNLIKAAYNHVNDVLKMVPEPLREQNYKWLEDELHLISSHCKKFMPY